MAKNLILEIAKMLGVELGEEFKVVYKTRFEIICNFTMAGLFVHKGDSGKYEKELLADIICGKTEIVKLPWKPKKGDVYFTFELLGGKWVVRSFWLGGFRMSMLYLTKAGFTAQRKKPKLHSLRWLPK